MRRTGGGQAEENGNNLMICRATCRKAVTHPLQLGGDVAASELMISWETITAVMTAPACVCCTDYFREEAEAYLRLPAVLWAVTSGQRRVHGGGFAFLLGLHRTFWSKW